MRSRLRAPSRLRGAPSQPWSRLPPSPTRGIPWDREAGSSQRATVSSSPPGYQDEKNYYLTRANALEDNVCWYYVQNGRRIEVKRVSVKVAWGKVGVWTKADSQTLFDNLTATPLGP
ncbi:MAG: hypothetical protein HY700_12120 [Gemmatimonadetes bacterium]|nr:hypothetical protein [Gemmatimonadota bacterium]